MDDGPRAEGRRSIEDGRRHGRQISSIEADKNQPVYNLDVAESHDFFVGKHGTLVHDFSFVQPVLQPFDRQPDLTTKAAMSTE